MTVDTKLVLKLALIYPFVIRGLYLLRQSFEPFYMNSICLLDLVRVSSPDHWNLHPTWKYFKIHMQNTTCESLTGVPMKEYFTQIYTSGQIEYKIFWAIFSLLALFATMYFLQRVFSGKVTSIVGLIGCAILSWNHGGLFHLFSHYQNDVSHINGNVMHHSNYNIDGY